MRLRNTYTLRPDVLTDARPSPTSRRDGVASGEGAVRARFLWRKYATAANCGPVTAPGPIDPAGEPEGERPCVVHAVAPPNSPVSSPRRNPTG